MTPLAGRERQFVSKAAAATGLSQRKSGSGTRQATARAWPLKLEPGHRYDVGATRMAKLKVFRMPIGFHDAYVAAPSQKAAIEAWGSGKDVFSRGEAEIVTDPKLISEPLAQPGIVIKRLRATADEQLAALPPNRPRTKKPPKTSTTNPLERKKGGSRTVRRLDPRPSRAALGKAEQALAAAERKFAAQELQLRARENALARERQAIQKEKTRETRKFERARDKAAAAYQRQLEKWRAS